MIKAIADYRAGRFADAAARLHRFWPNDGSRLADVSALTLVPVLSIRAMAHQRLGQNQEARELLVRAKAFLEAFETTDNPDASTRCAGLGWADWLHAHFFYNEAEKLLTEEGNQSTATDAAFFHHCRGEGLAIKAQLELNKKRFAAAAHRYSEAFADERKLADDLDAQHRYNAACVAALAGCGQGADVDKLDTQERIRLRQQTLDWLRADLKAYRQVMEKSAGKAGPEIARRMLHWLQDGDFAGVRGDNALAKLPEEERSAWRKLWDDVARMLTKAQGNAPAEKKQDTK